MVRKLQWWLLSGFALAMVFCLQIPEAHASANYLVEINKSTNQLILYQNGIKYKTYPVATGKTEDRTPEGTFHMVVKINQPGWKHIPGGAPNNPLGDRWLGISVNGDRGREYGIHGTTDPASIGTYASNGCVRMRKEHLHELYNTIPESTPVWIHKGTTTDVWSGDGSYTVQPLSANAKVKANKAIIRTGPSEGAFEKKQLTKGTSIQIIGQAKDWYQVKIDDKTGYVIKKNVEQVKIDPAFIDPFKNVSGMIETKVDLASIRTSPYLSGVVTQRVNKKVKVVLTGENKNWYRIRLSSGYMAYMHKSVAQKIQQPAPQAKKVQVTKSRVNIRTSASHFSPVLKTLNAAGKTFDSVGMNGDWYIIQVSPGQTGFIHKTLAK